MTRHSLRHAPIPRPPVSLMIAMIGGTLALIGGALAVIVISPGRSSPIPVSTAPAVAPARTPIPPRVPPDPTTAGATVVVGKRAQIGSSCTDEAIPGIDPNGTPVRCRPTPDGLRWGR